MIASHGAEHCQRQHHLQGRHCRAVQGGGDQQQKCPGYQQADSNAGHRSRVSTRYRDRIQKAESMVRRYGAWAIFIGRFIPAIRSLIPAALGISGFDRLRYSLLDVLACGLWSAALGLIVVALHAGVLAR